MENFKQLYTNPLSIFNPDFGRSPYDISLGLNLPPVPVAYSFVYVPLPHPRLRQHPKLTHKVDYGSSRTHFSRSVKIIIKKSSSPLASRVTRE